MALTLAEARCLTPGTVVHFGDENTLYIVKAVGYGWNMPVKVLVERYPEHTEGLETFFTDLQLYLVTVVGEAKSDETAPDGTSATPDTPAGLAPLNTSQQESERPAEAWQRADQSETGDPGADTAGDETPGPGSPADTPLEIPWPETSGPDQGREIEDDIASVRPSRRGRYKRG